MAVLAGGRGGCLYDLGTTAPNEMDGVLVDLPDPNQDIIVSLRCNLFLQPQDGASVHGDWTAEIIRLT